MLVPVVGFAILLVVSPGYGDRSILVSVVGFAILLVVNSDCVWCFRLSYSS